MNEWLKSLGSGTFTYGAKYVCFLPENSITGYRPIFQAPDGKEDSEWWNEMADRITRHLNSLRQLTQTAEEWAP